MQLMLLRSLSGYLGQDLVETVVADGNATFHAGVENFVTGHFRLVAHGHG